VKIAVDGFAFVAEFLQNHKQSDGIGSATQCDENFFALMHKLLLLYEFCDFVYHSFLLFCEDRV
jgi:hypothetical protein